MKKIFPFAEVLSPDNPVAVLSTEQVELIHAYNDKILYSKIEFEQVPCLCGSHQFDLIAAFDRYAFNQQTVVCIHCGLVQSNPRMTAKEYAWFYSSDIYRTCYDSKDFIQRYEEKYTVETGKHILTEIQKIKQICPGASVLEVGAGGGWNLLSFKEAGAEVLGIDYSSSLVKLGRDHGISMLEGSHEHIQGSYDVIVLNHVLEHFLNPIEALKKIVSHLNAQGVIYIAVPNIMNSPLSQLQNAHTYYFDPDTFIYYCSQAGLSCVVQGAAEKFHMFGIFRLGQPAEKLTLDTHYYKVLRKFFIVRSVRRMKNFLKVLRIERFIRSIYIKLRWGSMKVKKDG